MPTYFITRTRNQDPSAPGYYSIPDARDEDEARGIAFENFGPKWSGFYSRIEDIHPRDRKMLGAICGIAFKETDEEPS